MTMQKERKLIMKKSIALVLAVLMMLSLAACGGGGSSSKGGALPGVDMKSADVQTVTSDRATLEVLNETFFTYLGGLNYFTESDAQSKIVIRGAYIDGTTLCANYGTSKEISQMFVCGCSLRVEPKLERVITEERADNMEVIAWGNTIRTN